MLMAKVNCLIPNYRAMMTLKRAWERMVPGELSLGPLAMAIHG